MAETARALRMTTQALKLFNARAGHYDHRYVLAKTRQMLELESCLNALRIREVF